MALKYHPDKNPIPCFFHDMQKQNKSLTRLFTPTISFQMMLKEKIMILRWLDLNNSSHRCRKKSSDRIRIQKNQVLISNRITMKNLSKIGTSLRDLRLIKIPGMSQKGLKRCQNFRTRTKNLLCPSKIIILGHKKGQNIVLHTFKGKITME